LTKQPPHEAFHETSLFWKQFILSKSAFLWLPQPSNNGWWSIKSSKPNWIGLSVENQSYFFLYHIITADWGKKTLALEQ